jgi:NAD(P)H dehydrogenase (quinone)
MNIGIIVHSQSGHTYNAALKLQERLSANKHKVTIEQVTPEGDAHPGVKNLKLKTQPKVSGYDGLIFAAPVWAFTLSPVLKTYLAGISSLKGKKIAAFVTMGFPLAWMGGNSAIKQLKQSCESKSGTVSETAIIGRSGQDIKALNSMVEKLTAVFA